MVDIYHRRFSSTNRARLATRLLILFRDSPRRIFDPSCDTASVPIRSVDDAFLCDVIIRTSMLVAACDDNVGLTDSRSEVADVLVCTAHKNRERYQKLKSPYEYQHESEPQP